MEEKFTRFNQDYYDFVQGYYKRVSVFISSTFKDKEFERDYIINNLPNRLNNWGRHYGIEFEFVDLRWGISVSEALKGRVIPLCLKAINESVPFVVALYGGEYGTMPQIGELPDNIQRLIREYDKSGEHDKSENTWMMEQLWYEKNKKVELSSSMEKCMKTLKECIGKNSITDMEILQAVTGDYEENLLFLVKEDDLDEEIDYDFSVMEESPVSVFDSSKYVLKEYYVEKNIKGEKVDCLVDGRSMNDCIFEYITEKCKQIYFENTQEPTDYFDARFKEQCFYYGHYIDRYVFRGNELETLKDSLLNGMVITGYGKRSLMSAYIYYLIKNFLVDVVFSYENMDMTNLKYQMERMGRNMPVSVENVDPYGDDKPLVIAAASIEEEVIEYCSKLHFPIISFSERAINKRTRVIMPQEYLDKITIRSIIEMYLKRKARKLSDEQLEGMANSDSLASLDKLIPLIKKLEQMTSYVDVDRKLSIYVTDDNKIENKVEDNTDSETKNAIWRLSNGAYTKLIDHENKEAIGLLEEAWKLCRDNPGCMMDKQWDWGQMIYSNLIIAYLYKFNAHEVYELICNCPYTNVIERYLADSYEIINDFSRTDTFFDSSYDERMKAIKLIWNPHKEVTYKYTDLTRLHDIQKKEVVPNEKDWLIVCQEKTYQTSDSFNSVYILYDEKMKTFSGKNISFKIEKKLRNKK